MRIIVFLVLILSSFFITDSVYAQACDFYNPVGVNDDYKELCINTGETESISPRCISSESQYQLATCHPTNGCFYGIIISCSGATPRCRILSTGRPECYAGPDPATPTPTPTPVPCVVAGGTCVSGFRCNLGQGPTTLSCGGSGVCCQTLPPTPTPGGPTPTPATPCVVGKPVCPDGTICKLQTLDGKTSSVCIPGSASGDTPLSTAVCAKGLKSADCSVTDESCMTTEEKDIVRCLAINTAIGEIDTDPSALVRRVFSLVLGLAGGIALILIILSGYRRMASQGDPEKATAAKDQFTAAIVGLLFIIFSFVILQIIGFDILKIPGFNPTD